MNLVKRYWWVGLFSLIILPIILNVILLQSCPFIKVVGNAKIWLSFWGSYGGALIGSIITLYVLFKTLSQNENNNKETKELQINILKTQMLQSWLDNLVETLKQNINYINISGLNDSILRLKTDIEIANTFFNNEIPQSISKPIELSLHFSGNEEDYNEAKYLDLFRNIYVKYSRSLILCNKFLYY